MALLLPKIFIYLFFRLLLFSQLGLNLVLVLTNVLTLFSYLMGSPRNYIKE